MQLVMNASNICTSEILNFFNVYGLCYSISIFEYQVLHCNLEQTPTITNQSTIKIRERDHVLSSDLNVLYLRMSITNYN